MNAKYWLVGIGLGMASAAHAAGINWSYDGEKTYQKALIVWTDAGLGANPEKAIATARQELLDLLATSSPIDWDVLVWYGDRNRENTIVKADKINNPGPTAQRVNHSLYYSKDTPGWGFSLLANLDSKDRVIEFAINEVTPGTILSEIKGTTSLTIHDSDLTTAICGPGGYATCPCICRCGECKSGTRRSAGETFSLGISNAVKGFAYTVLESDTPNGTYQPSVVKNVVPETSGEFDFEIPIDPECKVKFFKVEVLANPQ